MHIGLHCFEYPPCNHGGIGSFTKDLAEGLVREGHEVTVFGFYYQNILDLDKAVEETINGVKIYRYPDYKKFSNERLNIIFSRIQLYRNIKALHQEKAFDVIETPENAGWLPFGVPTGIPMVTRLHGGTSYFGVELNRKSSRISAFLEKQQLKRSEHIVSVSEYTAKKTLEIFGLEKEHSVIYNSVQLPKDFSCHNRPIQEKLIVFSGSILPKKGVEELVKAMNTVCQEIPEASLMLAGKNIAQKDGRPYEKYLLEQVDEAYREKIHFLGAMNRENELFPLLCKAEVCCYPSHSEAFAIAPLEAMALGKAVVYSELHSGREALLHMESGLLCNPKEPTDIAEKILLLFNDNDLREKVAKNGKKRIKKLFNYEKWINSNIDLYRKINEKNKK